MNPTALWIPEFKKIWDRDKTKDKDVAVAEISYIVMLHGFHSPYQAYSEADREKKVLNDYFQDSDWKPDKVVQAAIDKYNELQDSIILRALRAARMGVDKITEFFENATPHDAPKIATLIEKLGGNVKSLDLLIKQVERDLLEQGNIRGGQEIGLFEI
jgi:hypothetical protein